MRKHEAFAYLGMVLLTAGAVLAVVDPQGVWPAAAMVSGLVCACTGVVLKELGR